VNSSFPQSFFAVSDVYIENL